MERSSRLILATILLSTVLTVAGFVFSPGGYLSPLASPPLLGATGGIIGSISIGPISPTCISGPLPSYYNQIQVRVTPSSGPPLTIPVRWLLVGGCWAATNFEIGLDPGAYSLTLTSCVSQPNSFGCSQLPVTAIVTSGAWTQVEISIETGIQ